MGRPSTPKRRMGGSLNFTCASVPDTRAPSKIAAFGRRTWKLVCELTTTGALEARREPQLLHRHPRDAEVARRSDDRPDAEARRRVVLGLLGRGDEAVGGAHAERHVRLEPADERADAEADAQLLDRLVRRPPADEDQRRAVERAERVARGRRLPVDLLGVRRDRRVRRVRAARDRPLLARTEVVRPGQRGERDDGRRAPDRRAVHVANGVVGVDDAELAGELAREAEPREVAEEARARVGEAGGVVPERAEVVGAGHERARAAHGAHAAVGEVETSGARGARARAASTRRRRAAIANERAKLTGPSWPA